MLPITAERLRLEVKQIYELISDLQERLDNGIPGAELPAHDVAQEVFQVQLRGELILASQRLLALGEILE